MKAVRRFSGMNCKNRSFDSCLISILCMLGLWRVGGRKESVV